MGLQRNEVEIGPITNVRTSELAALIFYVSCTSLKDSAPRIRGGPKVINCAFLLASGGPKSATAGGLLEPSSAVLIFTTARVGALAVALRFDPRQSREINRAFVQATLGRRRSPPTWADRIDSPL